MTPRTLDQSTTGVPAVPSNTATASVSAPIAATPLVRSEKRHAASTLGPIDPSGKRWARSSAGVADRITFVHGDARQHLSRTDADLVFLDPPWGVVDRVHCTEIPLLDELIALSPTRTWAKLPPSFHRPHASLQAWFGRQPGDRRRVKFVLWTLPRRPSADQVSEEQSQL